jgi:hypothetical protein
MRLHESMQMFQQVMASDCMANVGTVVFLNKMDVFAEKINAGLELSRRQSDFSGYFFSMLRAKMRFEIKLFGVNI